MQVLGRFSETHQRLGHTWLPDGKVQQAVPPRFAAGPPVARAQAAPDQAVLQRLQLLLQAAAAWEPPKSTHAYHCMLVVRRRALKHSQIPLFYAVRLRQ